MSIDLTLIEGLQPDELDGVLALRAVLRYGRDVSLYPRQVLICDAESDQPELSFIHGLPGSSGLAPVTFAQDKRMRRSLMERNGVPVPKGATFTFGRGVAMAKRFARKIGFPVVIKPAIGDNGIETFRDVNGPNSFERALDHLRKPTTERDTFTRAAYGLTELREPGVEDGKITVPPGYMFMVEKQLSGDYLRFLVNKGEVVSAIKCNGSPVDRSLTGGIEVLEDLHPEVVDMVENAAKVIPGLDVVALDAIVPRYDKPLSTQKIGFVEYSERPGLWVQAEVSPELPFRLSENIFRSYAEGLGASIPADGLTDVTLRFEAFAIPDAAGGAQAMLDAASDRGLQLELPEVNQLEGTARGTLSGTATAVAVFADGLLAGKVDNVPVMLLKLSHQ